MNGRCIDGHLPWAHYIRIYMAENLIDASSKSWSTTLVQQMFSDDIAFDILITPLFDQVPNDNFVKKEEKMVYIMLKVGTDFMWNI